MTIPTAKAIAADITYAAEDTILDHPAITTAITYRKALAVLREVRRLVQRGPEAAAREAIRLAGYLRVEARHIQASGNGWYPSTVEVRPTPDYADPDPATSGVGRRFRDLSA